MTRTIALAPHDGYFTAHAFRRFFAVVILIAVDKTVPTV